MQCGAQPDEASNTLTRRPATYNRILDSRTRQPADALIRVDVKILEHRLNANISRSSCPYLRAIYRRHHPLTSSLGKRADRNRATKSDKKRQRICRNMTLFVACNLPLVVTFCRPQSCTQQLRRKEPAQNPSDIFPKHSLRPRPQPQMLREICATVA